MNTPQLRNFGLPLAAALIALVGNANAATTVVMTSNANPGQYVATPGQAINNLGTTSWSDILGSYTASYALIPTSGSQTGIWTFCLEKNQYFSSPGEYNVSFSDSADGGTNGGPDKISAGTAYLYERFVTGSLYDSSVTVTPTDQGAALQNAIWILENEQSGTIDSYLADILNTRFNSLNVADYMVDNNSTTGSTFVGVMNLTATDGPHQDQLYFYQAPSPGTRSVPDGGASLILLGISLGGLGLARRFARA